jgi:hypothetical protein
MIRQQADGTRGNALLAVAWHVSAQAVNDVCNYRCVCYSSSISSSFNTIPTAAAELKR